MAISLIKVVKPQTKINIGKVKTSGVDLNKEIEQSIKKASECDQTIGENGLPQKLPPRYVTGKRIVNKRLPRKFTNADVRRITRKVLSENAKTDDCKNVELAGIVLYAFNERFDWVGFIKKIISLLNDFRDMYTLTLEYAALSEEKAAVEDFKLWIRDFNIPFTDDILVFIEDILDIPLDIVLLFEPLDLFLGDLIKILEFIIKIIELVGY